VGWAAQAVFIQADVRREDDVRSLVDQTVARFGRLDVAVNNAGTEGKPGPVTEQTPDSYAAMFDTNVLSTLLSLKHELRVMQPQGANTPWKDLTKSVALEAAAFGPPRPKMPRNCPRTKRYDL
jgi:NAD(P)-dependent dehydrogenase (short-subunit alcohol dehydrogenase family)